MAKYDYIRMYGEEVYKGVRYNVEVTAYYEEGDDIQTVNFTLVDQIKTAIEYVREEYEPSNSSGN